MKKGTVSRIIAAALFTVAMLAGTVGCNSSNNKPIVVVWYPNESAGDYESSRKEFGRLIEQATGRKVEHTLTSDYVIAIEALASGKADIGAVMGALGYIEAKNKNSQVDVLFVNSGASGTLTDAIYYSWLCVNAEDANLYKDASGNYSIANLPGKTMSFVSNSSTSGFKVPTTGIMDYFKHTEPWKNINIDDLLGLSSKSFFGEVLFGGSHQGSAFNLLSGKADIAAFCDIELDIYVDLKTGQENRVGAVYAVKNNATAPFNTVAGKEFVVIASTPVLNGPYAYNPKNLSADEVRKIRDLFTSNETANNQKFFYPPDSGQVGFYKKTSNERYLVVDDAWYNPIREM